MTWPGIKPQSLELFVNTLIIMSIGRTNWSDAVDNKDRWMDIWFGLVWFGFIAYSSLWSFTAKSFL